MIEVLKLKNFQSHEKSSLEFCGGVNCIVGSSDSGKTALLRALNWVINNRPTGDSFRSHWGGDTVVDIMLDEQLIRRERTKKTNLYLIDSAYDPKEEFKAFGTDVPEEVTKVLNFSSLNFQNQMDAPFLLSSGAGEVVRYLNQVVDLDVIHRSVSFIEKKKRSCNRDIANIDTNLSNLQEELKTFDDLELREKAVERLEEKAETVQMTTIALEDLETLLSTIVETDNQLSEGAEILGAEKTVGDLLSKVDDMDKKEDKLIQLKTTIHDIGVLETQLESMEVVGAEKTVGDLLSKHKEWEEKSETVSDLYELIEDIVDAEEGLTALDHQIESLEKKFSKLMPEECPLCGSEVKSEER